MPTSKQINYITFLLKSELPEVYKELPKHDRTHTNPKVDYSIVILEKQLSVLTHSYAQTLIDFINKHDALSARQMIYGLELPNNE